MNWTQRRWIWIGTFLLVYLIASTFYSGAILAPPLIPQTLYYAPAGLLRMLGLGIHLVPDPEPPVLEVILPAIHFVFWPVLVTLLIVLSWLPRRLCAILYYSFAALLLITLGGCYMIARG